MMTITILSSQCLLSFFLLTCSAQKTLFPTAIPTAAPTSIPTSQPTGPTYTPSSYPSGEPSSIPSSSPVIFTPESYSGGLQQNFTWYDPPDQQTFSAYSQHWVASHASWGFKQLQQPCETQWALPVCVDGHLLDDPSRSCPSNECMGKSYAVDPCQSTPIDTIDYVPPPITAEGVSAENVCTPTAEESFLVPPYFGLDAGIPPLYTPLKEINLRISGHVFGRTGDLCNVMSEIKIDFWHLKTDLLQHAYNEFYVPPEEVPLGRGEFPSDPMSPMSLRRASCRGEVTTSKDGKYTIFTTLPHTYGPPRHINIRVSAPGYETLITRVYFDQDLRLLQVIYDGEIPNRVENNDFKEEILQDGLQNSFRLRNSLHYGPNQAEYYEGFLQFGEEMRKELRKDPRVATLNFNPTETIYLDNGTTPHYKGIYEAEHDLILRPLRPLSDSKESPVNSFNLSGLWHDDATGGLVKVERKWGSVFGNIRGDTITGVDFRSGSSLERNLQKSDQNSILEHWKQTDTVWQNGAMSGIVVPIDAYSTNKDEGTIFWRKLLQNKAGDANQWHKVPHQPEYRYLKLEVSRVGGEQSSDGINSKTSGSRGGGGGRLVINEIEFYEGFLAQTPVPRNRDKMTSPRTPPPQRVSCSSFEDNIRHCFKAFDGDFSEAGAWISASIGLRRQSVPDKHWIMIDLGPRIGDRVYPTSLRIVCGNTVGNNDAESPEGCPMTFTLYGSTNPLKEFHMITHVDLYDYPEMNRYSESGGMVFNFFDETPFGRLNGQKCGSCDSPPFFRCAVDGYDMTCKSKFCGATGICSDPPSCPVGTYQDFEFSSPGYPALVCKNCPAGKFGEEEGLKSPECSGDCQAGCYCSEGSVTACQYPCRKVGMFCPLGSGAPLVPGMGEKTVDAQNRTNVDTTALTKFTSQSERESIETTLRVASLPCSRGHYCIDGFELHCPPGTYGNDSHLSTPKCSGECLSGTFCPPGSLVPKTCPLGHYCPDGKAAIMCPSGRYGDEEGLKDRSCSGVCPAGYFCPEGSTSATGNICPMGSYGQSFGLTNSSCSGLCAPGYFCKDGSTSAYSEECGDESVYCPLGSAWPISVSRGYYTIGSAESKRVSQKECEPGYYCVDGRRFPCPPGSFGEEYGLASTVGPVQGHINAFFCSGLCDAGHYCPFNSTSSSQVKCPAGRYGSTTGLTNENCTALCPLGHYCPAGTVLPKKCPAGVFGAFEGLKDEHCHPNCSDGLCSDQNIRESKCQAGFFCGEGSISPHPEECGSVDLYCPEGSARPTPASNGYYTIGPSPLTRTHQAICEEGFYCSGGAKIPCPPGVFGNSQGLSTKECTAPCPVGYYCPQQSHNGTQHRCPAGRYGSVEGLYNSACEGVCAAGYYCPEASTSPFERECGEYAAMQNSSLSALPYELRTISNKYYCPTGSTLPLQAPPGYFTVNGNSSTRNDIMECIEGTYCSEGIVRDCPAGRYGNAKKIFDPQCTGPCRKGFYCPVGSTSSVQEPCPQGTYGDEEGLRTAACSGSCQNPIACAPGSVKDMSKVY